MVKEITTASFEVEVTKSPVPVLVDFWAPWCGPCKRQAPILDELDTKADGKIKVCKLNIDDNIDVAKAYGVMSIPTLILFKNGQAEKKLVGLTNLPDLMNLVD